MSYLLFASDTFIFCDSTREQSKYLSWMLIWFETLLSLTVNTNGSEVIHIEEVE